MNNYQIEKQLRVQLERMTDKELEEQEQTTATFKHPVTGEGFNELAASQLALGVKRNPGDMARVKRIIAHYFPGLAQALLAYFPGDEDLKAVAYGCDWDLPPKARDANDYRSAVMSVLPTDRGPRVHNLLYNAERRAARIALVEPEDVNDAEVHLREERIDALASLMALFSLPDRYAVEPVEAGD